MVHGVDFIFMMIIIIFVAYAIWDARKGKLPYIRTISGLQAVDEAIGRATEMGKPILYVSGLADVNDVQTLASLSILSHIAQKAAVYDTPLIMPNIYSVTMAAAQEVVKEAHLRAGRPDTFKPDNIYYVSDEQFAFVAHLNGLMERQTPAANFYMGRFFAESLILAETGHRTGAIQIAGTAEASQLPFFVVACDYCLIGEELYAASAYLSKDPGQMGSIRAQDMTKVLAFALIILGCIVETFAIWFPQFHAFLHFLGG
jgi:hypothetical protein